MEDPSATIVAERQFGEAPAEPATEPVAPSPVSDTSPSPPGDDDTLPLRALLFRVLLIVAVLALGSAIFYGLFAAAPRLDTATAEQVRTRVLTYTPKPFPVQRPYRGYGTARALDATNVPARVSATVESVPERILEGATVRRGELIAQLDDRDFRAEVDRLDAALAEVEANAAQLDTQETRLRERLEIENEDIQIAEDELARVRRLTERNVTSEQDVDRARNLLLIARRARTQTQEQLDALPPRRAALNAQRQGLQAQRRIADRNYERTRVTASIAGVLQAVDVEPGESVQPGQRVARVVDPRIIEVPLQLPAAARAALSPGNRVVLRPTNRPGVTYDAELSRVAPEDDQQTRTVTAYALLNQEDASPNDRLAPGTFVEADVFTGDATPRVVVPRRALRKQRVQAVVDADGVPTIQSRPVEVLYPLRGVVPETGLADDQWAVLADDALPAGTAILATASSSLLDGEPVVPVAVNENAPEAAATDGAAR